MYVYCIFIYECGTGRQHISFSIWFITQLHWKYDSFSQIIFLIAFFFICVIWKSDIKEGGKGMDPINDFNTFLCLFKERTKIFICAWQRLPKSVSLYQIKKLVIFVHFKGFNISQKPKSSPLSYFAQKTSLNLVQNWYPIIFTCLVRSDSCSYISNIDIFVH